MNTNTLQPEYAEIAEAFLLAWDNGDYDSIPTEIFILELVEKCQAAALKHGTEIAALRKELEAAKNDAERLEFLLPIVTCVDADEGDKNVIAITLELERGLDGREAIDAAMQSGND